MEWDLERFTEMTCLVILFVWEFLDKTTFAPWRTFFRIGQIRGENSWIVFLETKYDWLMEIVFRKGENETVFIWKNHLLVTKKWKIVQWKMGNNDDYCELWNLNFSLILHFLPLPVAREAWFGFRSD